jgi:hypothetical protein
MMERRLQSAWIEPREGVKVAKERKEDLSRKKAKKGRKNGNPLLLIFFAKFLRLLAAKASPPSFQLSAFPISTLPLRVPPRPSAAFAPLRFNPISYFNDETKTFPDHGLQRPGWL